MEDVMSLDAYYYEGQTDELFYSARDRKRLFEPDRNVRQKRAASNLKTLFDDLKDLAYAMRVPYKGLQYNCAYVIIDGVQYDLTKPMQGELAMHDIMWHDIPDNVVVKEKHVESMREMFT